MSRITIRDLPRNEALDRSAMAALRGGSAAWSGSPFANVNVNLNQNITQLQQVDVKALNNVGVIGAGFGPLNLNVNPTQWANPSITI